MEPFNWSRLNRLQIGRYAEYLVKMEFVKHGMAVFSAEVDDIGVDLVVRVQEDDPEGKTKPGRHFDIQVKSSRSREEAGYSYIYCLKSNLPTTGNFYVALGLFEDGQEPKLFLIPATDWRERRDLFVDRKYDTAEYGLNFSKKHLQQLEEEYAFSKQTKKLRTL